MSRVLIVEDDLASLYAMKQLFERQGWKVLQSRTVAGCLDLLDPPPDWIVLDLGLADGDGEEVLRRVRDAAVPSRVAVLSGMLDRERRARLRPLQPDVMLQKPISFGDLLAACENRGVDRPDEE